MTNTTTVNYYIILLILVKIIILVRLSFKNILIELLKDFRNKLREKKEWELSDEIRSRLKDMNIVIEDKSIK